jgi:hypothetical protein
MTTTKPPFYLVLSGQISPSNPDIIIITLTAGADLSSWAFADITISNATPDNLTELIPKRSWSFTLTPNQPGAFFCSVPAGALTSTSGATNRASVRIMRQFVRPVATLDGPKPLLPGPNQITVIWSKPVDGLALDDLHSDDLDLSDLTKINDQRWTFKATPHRHPAEVSVALRADAATNSLGTGNEFTRWHSYSVPPAGEHVRPILERTWAEPDGTFTGVFGYLNENPVQVHIPHGGRNKFTPGPHGQGQPTVFLPGRQVAVFEINFAGGNLVWTLQSPNGSRRTATASSGNAQPRP